MSFEIKHVYSSAKQGILVSEACCTPDKKLCLPTKILSSHGQTTIEALIDSEAEKNLISQYLINQLQLTIWALPQPIPGAGVTGKRIMHEAVEVNLIISGNHRELGEFDFFSPTPQIILGFSWLHKHNPQIDWSSKTVYKWGDFCLRNCLVVADYSSKQNRRWPRHLPICPMRPLSIMTSLQCLINTRFSHYLHIVATAVLLNFYLVYLFCPADCINLSNNEKQAGQDYLDESLKSGITCASKSPLGGFCFVFCEQEGQILSSLHWI